MKCPPCILIMCILDVQVSFSVVKNAYFLREINKKSLCVGNSGGMWRKNPNFVV